ncbi:MAG: hypothetical protein H0W84_00620, partial [Bacteroidetes bacterium]|nr:hypothetical protein [Bacteroidota bacterium]
MALAILEFITSEKSQVKFNIDTGTNEFFYLKIGKSERERSGIKWVDGITAKTSLQKNENSKNIFNSAKDISIPSKLFNEENCYVQLFSFKNKDGKSPAFSSVLKIPFGLMNDIPEPGPFALSTSINEIAMITNKFNPQRNIPHIEHSRYSKQASIEDILSSVVRIAGPIVMGLLNGTQNNAPAAGTIPATAIPNIPQLGMLNTILNALLQGTAAPAPVVVAPVAPTAVSTPHSLSQSFSGNNRFVDSSIPQLSNQFIFGIDDALLATIAGPLISSIAGPALQMLPQLINSANQARLQNRQTTNKLVTDLVAETNRRMMLQQFLQNQQASGSTATAGGINMNQLLQLLQQLPAADPAAPVAAASVVAAPVAPVVAAPPIPVAQSLSFKYPTVLSTKTILSFEAAPGISFNGKESALYNKGTGIKLKLKLNIVEPAPKTALPKAIVRLVFKDNKNNTLLEKIFKQKDVMPNSVLDFTFSSLELRDVPSNTTIQVIAEMKWLTSQNREVKTLGNTEIVLVENSFIKEQGKELVEEKELTDMKVYRSFWNKIWESPVLDKVNSDQDGVKKYNWELNANVKYTFAPSTDQTSNGLMETKKLTAEKDPDNMTEKTEGRMKAGIELSISELNKLCSLWDKPVLSPEKLNALKTASFVANNTNEFIYNVKLKGKA